MLLIVCLQNRYMVYSYSEILLLFFAVRLALTNLNLLEIKISKSQVDIYTALFLLKT